MFWIHDLYLASVPSLSYFSCVNFLLCLPLLFPSSYLSVSSSVPFSSVPFIFNMSFPVSVFICSFWIVSCFSVIYFSLISCFWIVFSVCWIVLITFIFVMLVFCSLCMCFCCLQVSLYSLYFVLLDLLSAFYWLLCVVSCILASLHTKLWHTLTGHFIKYASLMTLYLGIEIVEMTFWNSNWVSEWRTKVSCSEFFRNCWSTGIFLHN